MSNPRPQMKDKPHVIHDTSAYDRHPHGENAYLIHPETRVCWFCGAVVERDIPGQMVLDSHLQLSMET